MFFVFFYVFVQEDPAEIGMYLLEFLLVDVGLPIQYVYPLDRCIYSDVIDKR